MSVRTFAVFQDEPAAAATPMTPSATATAALDALSLAAASDALFGLAPPSSPSAEKENVDPLTGTRSGLNGEAPAKKRKTGVLATKAVTVVTSSPVSKKRSASGSSTKPRRPELQRRSSSGSSFGGQSRRNVSQLETLQEQEDVVAAMTLSMEQDAQAEADASEGPLYNPQALIDSRVYELTVLPLADVSQAYDASPSPTSASTSSPESSTSALFMFGGMSTPTKSKALPHDPTEWTTPQRNHVLSGFTFRTPSPVYTVDTFPEVPFRPVF